MRRVSSATAVLVASLLCGCSFLATRGPGSNYKPSEQPNCSTSRAAPGLDTVVAIAGAALAVSMFMKDCKDDHLGMCSSFTGMFGATGLFTAGLWGAGAFTGFNRSQSCAAARAKHIAYIDGLQQHGPDKPWEQPADWDAPAPRATSSDRP
jgi:hypothetical protein